ncbi:DgyrCDS14520 [Dimorphilus gyrociliatus]|uniref:DgyrCDS14520 n=1 Tax=Dimorphilus gyrociliatus TaxID=2664684 RepID=A0A7I8WDW7_9ANNE|nr:DgyrCDS14520 [Dimorphilus gyrociliatus]
MSCFIGQVIIKSNEYASFVAIPLSVRHAGFLCSKLKGDDGLFDDVRTDSGSIEYDFKGRISRAMYCGKRACSFYKLYQHFQMELICYYSKNPYYVCYSDEFVNNKNVVYLRKFRRNTTPCLLDKPLHSCGNIVTIRGRNERAMDYEESYETLPICSQSVCFGENNEFRINSSLGLTFVNIKSLPFLYKPTIDFLVPGIFRNMKFLPVLFEFHSYEEKVTTHAILCKVVNSDMLKRYEIDQQLFESYKFWNLDYLERKLIFRCLNGVKALKDCRRVNAEYSYYDHQTLGIQCIKKPQSRLESLNNVDLRLRGDDGILIRNQLNQYQHFVGRLEFNWENVWYPFSNIGFDYHQVQIACQYFHFRSGKIMPFEERQNGTHAFAVIDCQLANHLEKCKVNHFMEDWLMKFYISDISIECTKQFLG